MQTFLKKYHPIPAIVSGSFVFIVCMIPGNNIPSAGFLQFLHPDKWVHAVLYAGWAWIWLKSLPLPVSKNKIYFILVFLILFGLGIEFLQQHFVQGRSAEIEDVASDLAGAIIGMMVYLISLKRA